MREGVGVVIPSYLPTCLPSQCDGFGEERFYFCHGCNALLPPPPGHWIFEAEEDARIDQLCKELGV